MTTKRILATSDGSARSQAVIPHAARLASAVDGELVLLRVLDPLRDCGDVLAVTLDEAVRTVSDRWSGELAAALETTGAAGRVAVEVRRHGEEIDEAILRVASTENAGILAMSSRGAGLLRHAALGSVALSIVGKLRVPMLVAGERVTPPSAPGGYHIVVTTDGSDDATRAVEGVLPLSEHDSVKVTLLRIHVPAAGDRGDAAEIAAAASALEELRELFPNPKDVNTIVRTTARLGGVDTAIVNVATEVGASVIAIASHGHSAKYHVFMGSTALGVLRQATLPLLLVRSVPASTP